MVEPLLLYSECSEQLGVAFKTGDEAGGVPAPAAHRLDFGVKLIDQRGERKLRAVLTSFFERDRHVLAHPVDGETEIELARSHRLLQRHKAHARLSPKRWCYRCRSRPSSCRQTRRSCQA